MTLRQTSTYEKTLHELKGMIKDQEKKYKNATNENLADDLYVTLDHLRRAYDKTKTAETN